jgi:hypothetical protein
MNIKNIIPDTGQIINKLIISAKYISGILADGSEVLMESNTDTLYIKKYTSIPEFLGASELIEISPNPAKNNLYVDLIKLNSTTIVGAEIRNIMGQVLAVELTVDAPLYHYNLKNIPCGLYYFIVKTKTGTIAKSFIKQ